MYASVESDREFARNVGRDDPQRAWILAPSDTWMPNPFYSGPRVSHPEDDYEDDDVGSQDYTNFTVTDDDEIPF